MPIRMKGSTGLDTYNLTQVVKNKKFASGADEREPLGESIKMKTDRDLGKFNFN